MNTEIKRFVPVKSITYPYKTKETAAKEADDYKYMRLGNGHYAIAHGEEDYHINEKKSPDGVDVIGCSCEAHSHAQGMDGCKHVAAFLRRSSKPAAAPTSRVMIALLAAGWLKTEHGNLYPADEIKAAQKQEDMDAAMDASWNKDHPEATSDPDGEDGEGSDPTPQEPPKREPVPAPGLGEKIYSRSCPHCDELIEGGDLDEVKRRASRHIRTCPKNPKHKTKTNVLENPGSSKPQQESKKTTDAKNATVDTSEQEEKPPMAEEETKTYEHPDGTSFETAEELLNYIEGLKDAQAPAIAAFEIAPMIRNLGAPQLSEVGGIRIGRKRQGGGAETFDHFIFTTPDKDPATGEFYRDAAMTELYGDNCRAVPVRFLSDNITEIFTTFYAEYGTGGMKIRGDGVNWIVTNPDGSKTQIEDPEGKHGFLNNPNIKPQGILTVLVDGQDSVGTVYRFRTTGWNSIKGMLASLSLCGEIAKRAGGRIAFLPMTLVYRTKEVTPKGERYKKTIPVITVEFRGSIEELQAQSKDAMQYIDASDEMKQLATAYDPETETLEAQEDVRAEFFPDAEVV